MVCQNLFLSDIFTMFIPLYSFFGLLTLSPFAPVSGRCHPSRPSLACYTLHTWNSVHIECKLPINCSHHPDVSLDGSKVLNPRNAVHTNKKELQIQYTYVAVAMEYNTKTPCVESQDGIIGGAYGCFLLLGSVACLLGEK